MPKAATRIGPVNIDGQVTFIEPGDEIPDDVLDTIVERYEGEKVLASGADVQPEPEAAFRLADATEAQIKDWIAGDEDPPERARKVLAWETKFKQRKGIITHCEKVIADPPAPASEKG